MAILNFLRRHLTKWHLLICTGIIRYGLLDWGLVETDHQWHHFLQYFNRNIASPQMWRVFALCQLPAEIMITKDTTLINYFIQRSYYTKHSRNLRAPILTAARSTKMTSQLSFHGRVSHRSLYVYLVSLALLQKECTFDFGHPFSHGCIWIHLNIFIHIATHI